MPRSLAASGVASRAKRLPESSLNNGQIAGFQPALESVFLLVWLDVLQRGSQRYCHALRLLGGGLAVIGLQPIRLVTVIGSERGWNENSPSGTEAPKGC